MSWLKLSHINHLVSGVLHGADTACEGVSIDTRTLLPGQLFVALRGERYDGHDFVENGVSANACAVMVESSLPVNIPQIIVSDTLVALQKLARNWRGKMHPVIVALTGSNGKTTTKEMLCSILSGWCRFQATQGNLNNHIGVPLSLLSLRAEDKIAVFEMGANHAGEIATLTQMIQPDIGLVTNAGPSHLEGFGSVQGVAQAKGELFEQLSPQGTAIINADDPYSNYWCSLLTQQKIVRFGLSEQADIQGKYDPTQSQIRLYDTTYNIKMPLPGKHNLCNALAACATACALDIPHDTTMRGLESLVPVAARCHVVEVTPQLRLIDDTYNANPASLHSALSTLSEYPGDKWLALGTMAELGDEATQWHAKAGSMARKQGVTRLFAVGPFAAEVVRTFGDGGKSFETIEDLNRSVSKQLGGVVTILVKGSRCASMERVVQDIMASQVA